MTGWSGMTLSTSEDAPRARPAAGGYDVRRHEGAEAVLDRLSALEAQSEATLFQSRPWLEVVARAAARDGAGSLAALEVTERDSGALVLLLPLVLAQESGMSVARIADVGLSDYRAPVVGPASPSSATQRAALWSALRRALRGVDLVRFEAMPRSVGPCDNPLALLPGVERSRLSGLSVTVEGTVEEMLRGRGKKYRKEAERCFRLLEKAGTPVFRRAGSEAEIKRAYAELEAQQSRRHEEAGNDRYLLDRPECSAFYRDLLSSGAASGFSHIFTLEAGDEIVAALLGVSAGGTFTLLRISNGGERWRHLSPGRLIVIEAMRHFVAAGTRTFDMGAGDYPFKRGFGAEETPLYDLVAAVSMRGLPAVAAARARALVRAHPGLLAVLRRFRGQS